MASVPFLKEVASYVLQHGEPDLSSTCIVFPNKRARLYMSKYIGELSDTPVWAPRYLTISELMEDISGLIFADRVTLLFELYEAYLTITHSQESFDTFYPYSETLLSDFDEVDKYLVDTADLFDNLSGLKAIDGRFTYLSEDQLACIRRFWDTFKTDNISTDQQYFLTIWDSLDAIYREFVRRLSEKGLAYEGMAYRRAVNEIGNHATNLALYKKYIFIGFNALNKCEEKLFRYLKNQGRAAFFWDYDTWYTNSEIHEAGYFIRENLKNFPPSETFANENLIHSKDKVLFIPVSSTTGQTAILTEVFDKMDINSKEAMDKTALVLADETLLIPTLYAIPASVSEINVTMGYPMGTSPVFSLVDSLHQLCKNAIVEENRIQWYIKDVLALMNNPVLRSSYAEQSLLLRKTALDQHKVYIASADIPGLKESDTIFNDDYNTEPYGYLLNVITGIIGDVATENEPLLKELLFQAFTLITRLKDVIAQQRFNPGTEVVFRLISKMLRNLHVPFSGEPLAGLQVLGILETRTLDFENVIMLSVNEATIPGQVKKPSFIPYNLRTGFGLPGPEQHDAIYAYYFYRLIQRAKNVALIYDSGTAGLKTGERSRFMHQILYEMNLPVSELHIDHSIKPTPVKTISIVKHDEIKASLERYIGSDGKALSPSALNEYLNCPLRFYFHHIAGLPQPDELLEEIDARLFGSILHASLKAIFRDIRNSIITNETLAGISHDEKFINECIDEAFNDELYKAAAGEARETRGYNLIIRQVIYAYVKQFLKIEQASCPFTIVSLEDRYYTPFKIIIDGAEKEIKIGGVIDRIDRRQGYTRILDYKTGTPDNRFVSVDALFNGEESNRNDAVFQVFLYAYVYQVMNPAEKIKPGLYFLRQSFGDDFSIDIIGGQGKNKQCIDEFSKVFTSFELLLKENLESLFNVNLPFEQTTNHNSCMYCPYAMICRR